jgi:hypothetical protein
VSFCSVDDKNNTIVALERLLNAACLWLPAIFGRNPLTIMFFDLWIS